MKKPPIVTLEAQIERLIEGAFTGVFRRQLQAHDVALQLARSMDDNLQGPQGDDPRPIAPDQYTIHLHPRVQQHWHSAQPHLTQKLSQHLLDLAAQLGYRMPGKPLVKLVAHDMLKASQCKVQAGHSGLRQNTTAAMQPIATTGAQQSPQNPQLVINGERTVKLEKALINIGRGGDNDIVLDDLTVSRHHAQLRLRLGVHTLFDVQSRGGTRVNGVSVREHRLASGDVVQVGNTRLIYIADDNLRPNAPSTTSTLHPVDPQGQG